MKEIQYIFVHGLSGWGSYDEAYEKNPYWGMRNGDLMPVLREHGYPSYAASVSPHGSAWDRACELYAQLSGTVTDYGAVHSRKNNHERYGPDFTGRALIEHFDEDHPLALTGHSFGGVTIRLFSHLMAYGCPEEIEESKEQVSDFFRGGHAGMIHSLLTLAAPHNGTTAYDLFEDPSFDPSSVKLPPLSKTFAKMMSARNTAEKDGRADTDYAAHDMHIDIADQLNRTIKMIPTAYYFSVPCSFTVKQGNNQYPDYRRMEPLFVKTSAQMGAYSGKTAGGIIIPDSWKENDGLVNTVSARSPSHVPAKTYQPGETEPGIWNVMPVWHGDHMSLQGGLFHGHEVTSFYLQMMKIISGRTENSEP